MNMIIFKSKGRFDLVNLEHIVSVTRSPAVNMNNGQVVLGKYVTLVRTVDQKETSYFDKVGDKLWKILEDLSMTIDVDTDGWT